MSVLDKIRREFSSAGVEEVPAEGVFFVTDKSPKLFPGGVYGFFAELTVEEVNSFFEEAKARNATFIESVEVFKPIEGSIYPIYWGKDKSIGKRPYEHLNDPKGTGSIRLSTYESLRNKQIMCITVIVDDNEKFETHLQNKYPHLLLTKTAQYNR